ncbi:unnamed protein product, partial [Ectocarpus sp. 8 AP-2014]
HLAAPRRANLELPPSPRIDMPLHVVRAFVVCRTTASSLEASLATGTAVVSAKASIERKRQQHQLKSHPSILLRCLAVQLPSVCIRPWRFKAKSCTHTSCTPPSPK